MCKEINIRIANIDDMKKVFDLSNDDVVRANSIHQEKIEWEQHVKWFKNRLNIEDSPFFIVEDENNNFISQVRIDKKTECIISISITKEFRGKNLSSKIIKLCTEKSDFSKIIAYIKIDNVKSLKSFIRAGYKIIEQNEDLYKLIYTKIS